MVNIIVKINYKVLHNFSFNRNKGLMFKFKELILIKGCKSFKAIRLIKKLILTVNWIFLFLG